MACAGRQEWGQRRSEIGGSWLEVNPRPSPRRRYIWEHQEVGQLTEATKEDVLPHTDVACDVPLRFPGWRLEVALAPAGRGLKWELQSGSWLHSSEIPGL